VAVFRQLIRQRRGSAQVRVSSLSFTVGVSDEGENSRNKEREARARKVTYQLTDGRIVLLGPVVELQVLLEINMQSDVIYHNAQLCRAERVYLFYSVAKDMMDIQEQLGCEHKTHGHLLVLIQFLHTAQEFILELVLIPVALIIEQHREKLRHDDAVLLEFVSIGHVGTIS